MSALSTPTHEGTTVNTCTCGKPTGDSTYLCTDCKADVRNALGNTTELVEDLTLTMSKQRRFGSPIGGSRSAEQPLPFNLVAGNVLRDLHHELLAVVHSCQRSHVPSYGYPHQPGGTSSSMARWLLWRLDGMAAQPWAADTLRLVQVSARGVGVIDSPATRTFAGPCDDCGHDLYARAGKQHVTCHNCGLTYDLAARRRWLLGMVHDRLATATEVARALTSLELPVTAERIRQWKHRGRLAPLAHDPLDRPLYRVGDVVDLLVQQAERSA